MTDVPRDLEVVARVLERLPDPSLLLDRDLTLVRFNPAFVAFSELRYRRLEPMLEAASSAFEVVGDPKHAEIARACLMSGRPTRLEDVKIQSPNGEQRIATVAFVPVSSFEGEPIGLIYSVRDVSGDIEVHKRYRLLLKQEQDRVRALEERESAVKNDLLEAKLFQESLLPQPPSIEGMRLSARYLPADMVSGDFYHIHRLDSGVRVLIADASGHGVQAGLRTMVIKAEYDQLKSMATDPATLLSRLSDRFAQMYSKTQLHFTACCFDVIRYGPRRKLRYAGAGHPAMFRLSGGRVEEIGASGPVPGLLPDASYALAEVVLAAGDRLLAFSDGFLEQARRDGTQFNEARMGAALERLPGSIDDAIDRGLGELFGFLGEDPQSDDITVVGVEIE